jgi:hypothetical protein
MSLISSIVSRLANYIRVTDVGTVIGMRWDASGCEIRSKHSSGARHYLPGMVGRGWGRDVFISSESALNTPEEIIHYGNP